MGFIILTVIRTAILIFILTILITIFSPIYVYRFILIALKKRVGEKLVCVNSSRFVNSDGSLPPLQNVILKLVVQGKLNPIQLKQNIINKILNETDTKSGQLIYPELQQYIKLHHGFPCWKNEDSFCIDKHLFICNDGQEQELLPGSCCNELIKLHLDIPFETSRSPWEVFVYYISGSGSTDQDQECNTLILFKFHHTLADGYAIFNAITKLCCEIPTHRYGGRLNSLPSIKVGSTCCSTNLYELVSIMSSIKQQADTNIFNNIPSSNHKVHTKSKQIPFEIIKRAAKEKDVSCTAVIITCLAQGIAKFMNDNYNDNDGRQGSKHLVTKIAIPLLEHTPRFKNQLIGSVFMLPLNPSLLSNFNTTQEKLGRIKLSAPALHYICQIIFALPTKLQKMILSKGMPGMSISIFPGPTSPITILEHNVILEIDYCINGFSEDPLDFCICTYNGQLCFWVSLSPQIVPTGKCAEELLKEIEEEFENLKKS